MTINGVKVFRCDGSAVKLEGEYDVRVLHDLLNNHIDATAVVFLEPFYVDLNKLRRSIPDCDIIIYNNYPVESTRIHAVAVKPEYNHVVSDLYANLPGMSFSFVKALSSEVVTA